MREILERFGLVAPLPRVEAAERVTVPSQMMNFGGYTRTRGNAESRKLRRDWRSMLKLSESPLPNRAISLIVDKVASLEYKVGPMEAFADNGTDYSKQIDAVNIVLDNPNIEDEDWPTVVRQLINDGCVFDTQCWEYVESPTPAPMPNNLLSLVPVPGWSIERTIAWDGDPKKPRWAQQTGTGKPIGLLNSQLEVIIMNRRTSVSYGLSSMEVAIGLMEAYLKLTSYQASVASEAYPAFLISLGNTADQTLMDRFALYWKNDLDGRGKPGLVGGMDDPKSIQLKAITDEGLYLKYQETLIRILAYVFKLKPQDFGIERDVNRGQGEVSQAASIEEAIRPYAIALQSRVTRRLIPRIAALAKDPKILELEYKYTNIDPWDEKEQTDLATKQWRSNGITRGEYRKALGYDAPDDGTDDMSYSEFTAQFGMGSGGGAPAVDENGDPIPETKTAKASLAMLTAARKKKA